MVEPLGLSLKMIMWKDDFIRCFQCNLCPIYQLGHNLGIEDDCTDSTTYVCSCDWYLLFRD